MTDLKKLRDDINQEADEVKKAELQKQWDDEHHIMQERQLLDDENFVDFEVKLWKI